MYLFFHYRCITYFPINTISICWILQNIRSQVFFYRFMPLWWFWKRFGSYKKKFKSAAVLWLCTYTRNNLWTHWCRNYFKGFTNISNSFRLSYKIVLITVARISKIGAVMICWISGNFKAMHLLKNSLEFHQLQSTIWIDRNRCLKGMDAYRPTGGVIIIHFLWFLD